MQNLKPNKDHLYFEEDVVIEKIVSGGYGLGHLKDNKIIMVKNTLPTERVRVRIKKNKKDFCFGKVLKYLETSPLRVKPLCPLFGSCGGCQFQMLDYPQQLLVKQEIIQESILRIGKQNIPVNPIVGSSKPFYYRNKGSFQVFNQGDIGFCKPGTTFPFKVEKCFLMEEAINDKIHFFQSNKASIEKMKSLNIRSNDKEETINSSIKKDSFIEVVENLSFIVDIDTFFQVNRSIVPLWLKYIKKLILEKTSQKGLLDLFCGIGFIAQYLASDFKKIIGIEVNKRLIQNGKKSLELNNIHNVELIEADASIFNTYDLEYDTIIVNPPRTGIHREMMDHILQEKPSFIIYSSCNPDTFARDIRILIESAQYFIDEIQPFDMFPQTHHTELVAMLYQKK